MEGQFCQFAHPQLKFAIAPRLAVPYARAIACVVGQQRCAYRSSLLSAERVLSLHFASSSISHITIHIPYLEYIPVYISRISCMGLREEAR